MSSGQNVTVGLLLAPCEHCGVYLPCTSTAVSRSEAETGTDRGDCGQWPEFEWKGRLWTGRGAGKAAGLETGEARLQERALRENIGDKGWKSKVGPKPKS